MPQSDIQSHESTQNPFAPLPKCLARNRAGTPCQRIAGRRGRCRLHGGSSTGPPLGNLNARKHGLRSRSAIAERKRIRTMTREAMLTMAGLADHATGD